MNLTYHPKRTNKLRFSHLLKKALENRQEHPELEEHFRTVEKYFEMGNKNWSRCKVIDKNYILCTEVNETRCLKSTLEIEDDFNRVTKLMMNEMNEKLWLTSLKEIELKEFKQDRIYRYKTLHKIKNGKGEISLAHSHHLTFLWERNSVFFMVKIQNLKKGKTSFKKISDARMNNMIECYCFERIMRKEFKKEGTRVTAIVVYPGEHDPDYEILYQYSMRKLTDFQILKKSSGLLYIETHSCNTKIEEQKPFLNPELEDILNQELDEIKKKRLLLAGEMDDRKCLLTEDQLEIFLDFKEKINSQISEELASHLTDNIYCRYLQGYIWELKTAEMKISGMLKWAKKFDFYNLKLEDFQDYVDKKMVYKLCEDKEGRPVFYFVIRNFIPSELDAERLALFNGVAVSHYLRNGPKKTDNYIVIYEYKGVNLRKNIDLKLFGKLTPVLGSYFPETLYRLYSINTNFAIRGIFQAAKAFIHPRTLAKIRIVGSGNAILEALKEDIDIDQIPEFLGGNDKENKEP